MSRARVEKVTLQLAEAIASRVITVLQKKSKRQWQAEVEVNLTNWDIRFRCGNHCIIVSGTTWCRVHGEYKLLADEKRIAQIADFVFYSCRDVRHVSRN